MKVKVGRPTNSAWVGQWMTFARRADGVEAFFLSRTKQASRQAAYDWVGGPEVALDSALDELAKTLEKLNG